MKYIFKKYLPIFIFTILLIKSGMAQVKVPETQNTVRFTENKNQWDTQILYRAQLDGGVLFLENNCFTYSFYDKETLRKSHNPKAPPDLPEGEEDKLISNSKCLTVSNSSPSGRSGGAAPIASHAFRMTFINALNSVITSATNPTSDYCNYFIGNDKNKWAGGVKNYKEVNYKNIYDGIDLQVLGLQNSLKYNFILAPYANADNIKLYYQGLDKIILENNALKLTTSLNELMEQKPFAYQQIGNEKIQVPCKFVLENTTVSFIFPHGYNKQYTLVIDPVLVFAASSGSFADNFGMTATYDAQGNLYSGGTCFDQGYPTTLGAYDRTYNGIVQYGRTDVVITKYDSSGTFLRYSTYLGGAKGTEIVTSLIVDAQNNLLLYGATGSSDFPITANAYDKIFKGGKGLYFKSNGTYFINGTDIYISKFNTSGTSLLSSTFIGGRENDGVNTNESNVLFAFGFNPLTGNFDIPVYTSPSDSLQYNYGDQYRGEINVDKFGNICIASSTRSPDFPIINGFDNTLGGQQDAVVFKLNSNLSQMLWSSYLGGNNNDAGYALALDDSANVYVTGGTRSFNFPTTVGALKTTYAGGKADGYVTKIKFDGSAILSATYLGTANYDQSYFVQLDKSNNVYLVGQSEGKMPVTDSSKYFNANSSQFISKLNNRLTTLIFSTVFGNGDSIPNISPSAFLVDDCENIYVSGWGGNIETNKPTNGMPLLNAIQPTTDGYNFYLIVLAKDVASLIYATYFGGAKSQEHVDGGTSRFDKKGVVYQSVCAGCGGNDDFPVTPGAWPGTPGNPNYNDNCNNGVFKFDFEIAMVQADFTVNQLIGCDSLTVNFKNQSTAGSTFLWDFGGGDTTSVIANPTRTFLNPGKYLVKLYVTNPSSCNNADTTFSYITINPTPVVTNVKNDFSICSGSKLNIPLTSDVNSTFTWATASTSNVSGESAVQKKTSTISDVLVNTTLVNQILTYTVVPTSIATQCSGKPFFINVLVHPAPNVNINNSISICSGTKANIPLQSAINSTYTWIAANNNNVSGETTSQQITTNINDSLVNSTVFNQTVIYTITPTSISNSCVGAAVNTSVLVYPIPMIVVNTSSVCSGNVSAIQLTSNINSTFEWFATDNINVSGESLSPQTTTTINDLLYTTSTANQTVVYTITATSIAGQCVGNSNVISVIVYPGITADFDFENPSCSNKILFHDSSAIAPVSWLWYFDDGDSSTVQNPQHTYTANGIYDVELITSSINNCKDTAVVQLNFKLSSIAISNDTAVCIDNSVQLNVMGGVFYNWLPQESLNDATIANPIATPTVTTTYTVSVTSIQIVGDTCTQTVSTTVNVIDPTLYIINVTANEDTLFQGQSTTLYAITDSALSVSWIASSGVKIPRLATVLVTPETTTTYTVSILGSLGCPKSAIITIYVIECDPASIFVPNTFTPNGDGKNDVLYVRGNSITELYFAVYNRWGQLVFETTDITKGWNGIYNNMKADPAVFAWYLKAKCFNGETLEKKGNVTLIR